ncbi:cytochrome P450 [Phycomyces nitens]|nr:cytochrome P450 [Phycomyces nitens]
MCDTCKHKKKTSLLQRTKRRFSYKTHPGFPWPATKLSLFGAVASAAALCAFVYLATPAKPLASGTRYLPQSAPNRLPILGHLLFFIKPSYLPELFRQWSLVVGPVYTVYLGRKRWVILNSAAAVKDLIVDRGSIYSSRDLPLLLIIFLHWCDSKILSIVDKGGGFAFFPYGKQWRDFIIQLRHLLAHSGLVLKKIDLYQPILNTRRKVLLKNLSSSIDGSKAISLTKYIEHFAMTNILTIAFADLCSFEPGDPKLHEVFSITERSATLLGPSEQLVEFFPILKYILPSQIKKFQDVRQEILDFYGDLLREFKMKLKENPDNVKDCFMKEILAMNVLTDIQCMYFIALFVGAGSETITSTIEWTLALLANNPDIQDRAFEEIEKNIGLDCLPSAEDEHKLPFIQCIIHETLRIRSPAPISVPHSTSKDDVYNGAFIPEGTTVVINVHAIHLEETRYPEAKRFLPDRHMSHVLDRQKKIQSSQSVEGRPHIGFSAGRRACVGIHLAERTLFTVLSGILACFRIERETEELLNDYTPKDNRAATFAPTPYKVRLVHRHKGVSGLF